MRWLTLAAVVIGWLSLMSFGECRGDDWPQWLGPQRDSVYREDGVIDQIPQAGLKVKWRSPVSLGYSGPAVVGDRVYLMDYVKKSGRLFNSPGGRAKLQGQERILCFNANNGQQIWQHAYDCPYSLSYPAGPRCTPTVADGKLYAFGAEGDLWCLKASDGSVVWHKQLTKEYQVKTPIWGFAAHPLVDGDRLYCLVGGEGSVAVAFNKDTGEEIWRALSSSEPGYCPPTMIEHAGVRQLLIWNPTAINALDPQQGKVLWSVPLQPSYAMSICAPRLLGDKLYACGIGAKSALLQLDSQKPDARVLWRGKPKSSVYCSNSTPFLADGMIYGADIQTGALIGARLKDGQRVWQTTEPTTGSRRARHGTVFLVNHQPQGQPTDRFFLFTEKGDLILARLTPEEYKPLGKFHVLEPTNEAFGRDVVWSHPAFARKCLFARNDKELVCVSLQAED